ncbi:MAG: MBL fold metallo-hydrolase [Gammaproteobacteria bacterium]|nr:MBL fold metallo-hydrolase [Gammaproteobacteria bacterium]
MRITPFGLLLSLILLPIAGQTVETELREYPASQISSHVWVIEGPLGYPSVENQGFMNNPAFVVTGNGVVVIDPGSSLQAGRMVLKQIQKVTAKPVTHVLDTHVHGDHWLGNQAMVEAYPEVVLIGHPQMIKRAHDFAADDWLKLMLESTDGFTAGTRAVIPERSIEDEAVLEIGGVHFKIYAPKAAHSGTDIMIEVVEEKVMFLGDNVTYKRIPRLNDATFKGNINACDVALKSGAEVFVPGHGPVGGQEVVEAYGNYLRTIYSLASRYYEEDMEDFEMKPMIVEALDAYKDWVNFEGQIGRHISIAVMEYENSF